MQVYQLIWGIKFISKEHLFSQLLVPLCSSHDQSVSHNSEHADQVCLSIHWPSWIQVKFRAWLHTHGALFQILFFYKMNFQSVKIDVPACTSITSNLGLRLVLSCSVRWALPYLQGCQHLKRNWKASFKKYRSGRNAWFFHIQVG